MESDGAVQNNGPSKEEQDCWRRADALRIAVDHRREQGATAEQVVSDARLFASFILGE